MARREAGLRRRELRLAASLVLTAAAVGLLGWGFWPERQTVHTLALTAPGVFGDEPALSGWNLTLEYPDAIRLNDRATIRLAFEAPRDDAQGQATPGRGDVSGVAEMHAIAEARLEIPGATVRPPESIYEALAASNTLKFYWSVVLRAPGTYRGTAWSFLTTRDEAAGDAVRTALGAQNVEIECITLLGMSGEGVRFAGGASLIAGFVLGLPFVEPALRAMSQNRGRRV